MDSVDTDSGAARKAALADENEKGLVNFYLEVHQSFLISRVSCLRT